jgi:hypothetical protein
MECPDDGIRALMTTRPETVVMESNVTEIAWRIPNKK